MREEGRGRMKSDRICALRVHADTAPNLLGAYPFWSDGDLEGRQDRNWECKLRGRRDRVGWIYAPLKGNRGQGWGEREKEGKKGGGGKATRRETRRQRETEKEGYSNGSERKGIRNCCFAPGSLPDIFTSLAGGKSFLFATRGSPVVAYDCVPSE